MSGFSLPLSDEDLLTDAGHGIAAARSLISVVTVEASGSKLYPDFQTRVITHLRGKAAHTQ